MLEHEQAVEGNAAVEEMQATPELEAASPSEIRALSSEVTVSVDQANLESEHESTVLQIRGEQSDEEVDKEELRTKWRSCSVKKIVGLLLLGFVLFIIIDTATNGYTKAGIEVFLEWIEDHPIGGMFIFILVYVAAAVLFIPALILTLGAGFVFASAFGLGGGMILGTLTVFIGASLGAISSYFLGRYLLREFVQTLTKKYTIFEALNAAVHKKGLKIFILLRLSPIIPYNATNYIGGVSAVSFRDFILALFGMLPGTILYVFLGASAGSLSESSSSGDNFTVTIIVVSIGAVFGIATLWLSARYARKEFNRIVQERQAVAQGEGETGDEMKDVYLAMV